MLAEIRCDKFVSNGKPRDTISFHQGLNVVLGSEAGDNSIGKSTFLMIVDFAFGGNDYVQKSTDVQTNVLGHTIQFAFDFNGTKHYFSRETVNHTVVYCCNKNYEQGEELRVEDYRKRLLELYGITLYDTTFRDIIARYFRVYGRDNLDEKEPLLADKQEAPVTAIKSLMKLFDKYEAVAELTLKVKEKTEEKDVHRKAQRMNFIPNITKTTYKSNAKRIESLELDLVSLQDNAEKNLMGLDSKEAEILADLRQKLTNARRNKSRMLSQLRAIENDMELGSGLGKRNAKFPLLNDNNYEDEFTDKITIFPNLMKLQKFFPEADMKQIQEIEQFHNEMTNLLNSEFRAAKESISALIDLANKEILELEQRIRDSGMTPKISKAVLSSYADKNNEIAKLKRENNAYETMDALKVDEKELKTKLEQMQEELYSTVENDINIKMNELNDYIYDGEKKSPVFKIKKSNSYTFYTPDDTGTGTSYKGLIVFDLSILALTVLPAIIHDSVALKQIADEPLEKIMSLYSKSEKQIFIALDKKGSYTPQTQKILDERTILRLSPGGNELFGRSWNEKQEDSQTLPHV